MRIEKNIARIILGKTEEGVSDVKKAVHELYSTLEERKLLHLLPAVVREIKKITLGHLEEEKLVVNVAHINNINEADLIKKFGASKSNTSVSEDNSLIAGAKIKFRGKEFDISAKGQVSRLRRALNS